eukprot:9330561-Alexandrium_andersonii.AAC.1
MCIRDSLRDGAHRVGHHLDDGPGRQPRRARGREEELEVHVRLPRGAGVLHDEVARGAVARVRGGVVRDA